MIALLFTVLLAFLSVPVSAQVTCFDYGNTLSCDGPGLSNRTFTELGDGSGRDGRRGIMTDDRGHLESYYIAPSVPSKHQDHSSRLPLLFGTDERPSSHHLDSYDRGLREERSHSYKLMDDWRR